MTEEHAPDSLLELDEVNQLREQLETERRAFEASREVWKHQRERQEQQLLAREGELYLREQEVEQQRQLLERERQTWEQQTVDLARQMAEAASVEHDASSRSKKASAVVSFSETPSDTAPSDTGGGTDYDPIVALEQLRRMVETEKEEEEEEPQDESIRPIASAHQPAAPATRTVDNGKHEESIDDYMSKLMSRVNGKSERIGPEPISSVSSVADSPAQKAATPPGAGQAGQSDSATLDDDSSPSDSHNPASLRRRSAQPDLTTHLTTMREVANTSARTAIDTSARRKRKRAIVQSSAVVAAVFGTAGYMVFGLSDLLKIAAVFAGCIGAAMMLRAFRNMLSTTGEPTSSDPAAPTSQPDQNSDANSAPADDSQDDTS